MIGPTLADYVWGDAGKDFTGAYGQTSSTSGYSFATDSAGRVRVPTLADVGAAPKTEDKLSLLTQLADVVGVRADAGLDLGRSDSVADMAAAAEDMLSTLEDVASGLFGSDGDAGDDGVDPALKSHATQIGTALTSLRNAMDKVAVLAGSADAATASQITAQFTDMDERAGDIAAASGLSWRRSGTTFRPDPTKVVDLLV